MKIHATDCKVQRAKVVYDGNACTTVAVKQSSVLADSGCKDAGCQAAKSRHPDVTPNHRQRRCWTCGLAACGVFSILASVGLFVLLYSAASPIKKDKYEGMCEIPILPDERQRAGYTEHMTADKENSMETFEVPEIHSNHPATILYDFYNEITVYLDRAADICFIMNLNTTQVVPPESLLETFIRYKRGDFTLNLDTIRETMEVQTPSISDISFFGIGTMILCEDRPAYWLVKSGLPALRKRSVSSEEHHVTYFNGRHMIDLRIARSNI